MPFLGSLGLLSPYIVRNADPSLLDELLISKIAVSSHVSHVKTKKSSFYKSDNSSFSWAAWVS